MENHHQINYIEMPSKDLAVTKNFFGDAFGWKFVDYGPDYASFLDAGIGGGFYTADQAFTVEAGSPLVVLYSSDIEATQTAVESAGGKIVKPIFPFPGGRRFHFADPNGCEYAVWSE